MLLIIELILQLLRPNKRKIQKKPHFSTENDFGDCESSNFIAQLFINTKFS